MAGGPSRATLPRGFPPPPPPPRTPGGGGPRRPPPPRRGAGGAARGGGWDAATIRLTATGKVQVIAGTSPHGQGHATTFAQIVADDLGVPFDDIEVITGDTTLAPLGMDTYGSRSLAVGGIAVHRAAMKIVEKTRKIAAHELEVSDEDLDYASGTFSVKGAPDRAKTVP